MFEAGFERAGDYNEFREHEFKKRWIQLVDGNLTTNDVSTQTARSARVLKGGYWGFSSSSEGLSPVSLGNTALANAKAMGVFGKTDISIPSASYIGEHGFSGQPEMSSEHVIQLLQSVNDLAKTRYKGLNSATLIAMDETHNKYVQNSLGSRVLNNISRAVLYVMLIMNDSEGKPVRLFQTIHGRGGLGDLDFSMQTIEATMDEVYTHLVAKCDAVYAKGGKQTVVLAPQLAGILAHEAMGHPCEADLVLGGAVTGDLRGKKIASEMVTMVDFAHSYNGETLQVPVYADDEGTPAIDATLIKDGVLTDFMHNRASADHFGDMPTGNARAYAPDDEPLIRMRNTAILPGTSKLEEMIAGVEDGYYLMHTGNGQADTTTEFMFGVRLGYEIKNGILGKAIKDTTISGSAIKMLQSVDALSDDMYWESSGYCGKKQRMVVSMGGPAIRAQAQLGGE